MSRGTVKKQQNSFTARFLARLWQHLGAFISFELGQPLKCASFWAVCCSSERRISNFLCVVCTFFLNRAVPQFPFVFVCYIIFLFSLSLPPPQMKTARRTTHQWWCPHPERGGAWGPLKAARWRLERPALQSVSSSWRSRRYAHCNHDINNVTHYLWMVDPSATRAPKKKEKSLIQMLCS